MDGLEITIRFVFLLLSLVFLFLSVYISKKSSVHPMFLMIGICTFFLCLIFTQIEITIGMGFGLFAIFSILRFRTVGFNVYTIVLLFVSIALSVLDVLYPFDRLIELFVIHSIILVSFLGLMKFSRYVHTKSFQNCSLILPISFLTLDEVEKTRYIQEKTTFLPQRISIQKIDEMSQVVHVTIEY